MTDSLIPYSFIPGTKAKAQEVNANFIALANSITENTTTLNSNKLNKDLSNITQAGIDVIKNNTTPPKNMGEIVASTVPLTDAGLHLLDGALISGSGTYGAFVNYIAEFVSDYPDLFETEANWQSAVTTYGACGKFVYDDVNNTVRLPKITGFIEGTTDLTALGDLVEAGLPNITGSLQLGDSNNAMAVSRNAVGAFGQGVDITSKYTTGGSTSSDKFGFDIDASRSSSIYGNSSTVQPQTIKVLYYIVISNTTKTEIEVDIDEVATDLNGKAGIDLTNINDQGKIAIAHNAMPSNTYETLTLGASGSSYTAPADGWFYADGASNNGQSYMLKKSEYKSVSYFGSISEFGIWLPVFKGESVTYTYGSTYNNDNHLYFIYAQGSESEAS